MGCLRDKWKGLPSFHTSRRFTPHFIDLDLTRLKPHARS